MLLQAVDVSADDAAAKVLIYKTIDRRARRLGNTLCDVMRDEGFPSPILKKGGVENDCAWRQLRELSEEFLHGQRGQISEGQAPLIGSELLLRCLEEFGVEF